MIYHTKSHVVGQDFFEDNLRHLQIKEGEMNAKKLTCDVMYI